MSQNRPPIPAAIKREVRQRCGFGCVICGNPIYEYEHMEEWSIVKRHIANEITLLCPQHHTEKTKKLLPISEVKKANNNPFNLKNNQSSPHKLFFENSGLLKVNMGSVKFIYEKIPDDYKVAALFIDGVIIIGYKIVNGNVFLTCNFFDENNQKAIEILDNELIYKMSNWDVEWVQNRLTFRTGKGEILLELIFENSNTITLKRGLVLYNGIKIKVGDDLKANNFQISGTFTNCIVGVALGHSIPDSGGGFALDNINRYKN